MISDWQPLLLTFKLASFTTCILIIVGVPFAWWLSSSSLRIRPAIEAIVSLPLVLPPSVLGFYLLIAFSPENFFGRWLDQNIGLHLAFSFKGLVIASVIYSFPFLVQPVQSAFKSLPRSLTEASQVLGNGKVRTFLCVQLPNIKPALLAGTVMAFAHTVGEFGVVLMIGGNIPGQTRLASIAIYDEVEALNYQTANFYALVLVVISFLILLSLYIVNRQDK